MHWVCRNWHPAFTFLPRRMARISKGSAKGFSAAPMKRLGRPLTSSPPIRRPSSRIIRTVLISCMESMSKTFLPPGWSPKLWWSPERQRMLLIPRAAAPRMSLWRAIRLRSRHTICRIGSNPISLRMRQEERELILTTEVWLSVTLTASTTPLSRLPFFRTASASAPFGGPHSDVTTNAPFSRRRSIFDCVITAVTPPSGYRKL